MAPGSAPRSIPGPPTNSYPTRKPCKHSQLISQTFKFLHVNRKKLSLLELANRNKIRNFPILNL